MPRELVPSGAPASNAFLYTAISGDRILVGDDEDPNPTPGAAYLFDFATGNQVRRLTAPDGIDGSDFWFGQQVALTDDYAVVSGSAFREEGVYLYERDNGDFVRKIVTDEFFSIAHMEVSDEAVIVADFGNTAKLFDLATGAQLREFTLPNPTGGFTSVQDLALTSNYAAVSSSSSNGSSRVQTVQVFDVHNGGLVYSETGVRGTIELDGSLLMRARGSSPQIDNLTTQVFNFLTGDLVAELPAGQFRDAAFSDGRLAVGLRDRVIVYQIVPEPSAAIAVLVIAMGLSQLRLCEAGR